MATQEEVRGLDKALTHLETLDQDDPGVARAMTVLTEEMSFEEGGVENDLPKEPVRKEVAAATAGGLALIIVYAAGLAGLEIPGEVAAAVAAIVAALAGYIKSEF